MGNRAVITTAPYKPSNVGVYVHWNGGRASIEGFLKACKELGYRSPEDDSYGIAGLVHAIATYFNYDGLSIGVDVCKNLDCEGNNGVYVVGDDWTIVGRRFFDDGQEEVSQAKTDQIAAEIVAKLAKKVPA